MRLAEALLGFPDAIDAEFRHTVLKEMGAQLHDDRRPLEIRHAATASEHLLELSRFCERHRDPEAALKALWTTLRFLRRDEAALVELRRCIDWLTRRGRLPERQLARLEELSGRIAPSVPRAVMEQALQAACGAGRRAPLRGRESLPEAVRRLDQARGNDHDDVPLVLLFLAELAARLPDRLRGELREEIGAASGLLGLPDEDRLALSARTMQPAPGGRMILQVRVEEVSAPAGGEQYVVEAHLYERDDVGLRLLAKRERPDRLGGRELVASGADLLVTWNDLVAAGDQGDDFRIEFLLPWSLLGHPADLWGIDADGYRVGFRCPVVVRSLDRLREPSWRRPWQDRWKLLHDKPPEAQLSTRCGWLAIDAAADAPERLEGLRDRGPVLRLRGKDGDVRRWLDTHADVACLGLAFAYEPTDAWVARGVKDAVREGIPAIIWRRDGGDPGPLISRLGDLAAEELPSLPELLRRWRRSAQEDDDADMHNHLTLLWDDPDCVDVSLARHFAAPVWTTIEQEQEQ
ncbi:hypothetical protein [Streptomyces sp. NPDC050848]|uniref:VMAP-C domain-containing protein n=1 Tax=Streptomyces sp. NPDC050848 TaxID=3155791 RepID=UPI0033FCB14C